MLILHQMMVNFIQILAQQIPPQEVIVGNNNEETVDGATVNCICINQRHYTYTDYDILNCGTSTTVIDPDIENYFVLDCNT